MCESECEAGYIANLHKDSNKDDAQMPTLGNGDDTHDWVN